MRTQLFGCLAAGCLLLTGSLMGQKNIILNEELNATADQYKVKLRTQGLADVWKMQFGDYSVNEVKGGWPDSRSKSNVTGTKEETKSSKRISFDLQRSEDVASVKAVNNVNVKSLHGLRISPNFTVGRDELANSSNHIVAEININHDTANTWTLAMKSEYDAASGSAFEGLLSDGLQKINITSASSSKEKKPRGLVPALGYQFDENGKYLAAVQYYGGGLGVYRNIIWIQKDLPPKTTLVLAAAMTAILQFKIGTTEEGQVLTPDE